MGTEKKAKKRARRHGSMSVPVVAAVALGLAACVGIAGASGGERDSEAAESAVVMPPAPSGGTGGPVAGVSADVEPNVAIYARERDAAPTGGPAASEAMEATEASEASGDSEASAESEPSALGAAIQPLTHSNDGFVELDIPVGRELQEYIWRICGEGGIDFALVIALMEHESGFHADAVSATGDYGLMQINASNHAALREELGTTDFLEPYQNAQAGVYILRTLYGEYGETPLVLMAYNMGEDGARRLWRQGVYETSYSREVMERQAHYAAEVERGREGG